MRAGASVRARLQDWRPIGQLRQYQCECAGRTVNLNRDLIWAANISVLTRTINANQRIARPGAAPRAKRLKSTRRRLTHRAGGRPLEPAGAKLTRTGARRRHTTLPLAA